MKKWLCLVLTVCLLLSGVALAEQPAETTATAQEAVALDLNMVPSQGQSVSMEVDNLLTFGMVDEDSVFLTLDGGVLNNLPNATLYWHKDCGLFLRNNKAGTWTELTLGDQKLTLDNLQKMVQSVKELSTWMTSASMPKDMQLIGQALVNVAENFRNSPEVLMALARLGVGGSGRRFSIDNATVNAVLSRVSVAMQEAVDAILAHELLKQLSKETRDAINAVSRQLQLAVRDFVKQVENLELPGFSAELLVDEKTLQAWVLCDVFQLDITCTEDDDDRIIVDGKLSLTDSPAINISGTIGENAELIFSSGTELHRNSWEARLLLSYSSSWSSDELHQLLHATVDFTGKTSGMLEEFQRLNLSYLMKDGRESTSHVLTIDTMGDDDDAESLYAEFRSSRNKWSGSLKTYTNTWAYKEYSGSLEMLDEGIRFTFTENDHRLTAELSAAEGVQVPVPGDVTQVLDLQQLLTTLN